MERRALVPGASISGLATAFWLSRTGWRVDLVERAPRFRDGGQNVDVRGAAHEVVELMGLTEAVRSRNTTEEGTSFIGARGQLLGAIPADQEQDGPTAELEILRGDLARLILDVLPETTTVRYDDRVTAVEDGEERADVAFESGATGAYDLVVVAEGVRSTTRELVFGGTVDRHELGLTMAYGTIPRAADDDRWWRWYSAPGRRGLTLRPDDVGTIRATLAYVDRDDDITLLPLPEAKRALADVFADAGWESPRVTAGFLDSDDVYLDRLTQIRMGTWSSGRVVVTGDAAWCVTPLGGGGTSLALVGGYVLAAQLSGAASLAEGLHAYEAWMRPLVAASQHLPKGVPDLFYPKTLAGVRVLRAAQAAAAAPPLRRIAARFSHVARTDQALPAIAEPASA